MDEKIEAVQRMQTYIDNSADAEITLSALSRASYYSPWYSARIFKELTGLSPAEYVRKLKLARSALRLRDDKCKITELAFEYGFDSVEGYTRAFYREFGINPKEYALNPVPLRLFIPYGVKFKHNLLSEENKMENVKNVFIQVIDKPERKVIIKRGIKSDEYMSYCEEVGCDVWGILTSMKSLSGEPVCMWLPEKYRPKNTSKYVQGVEVSPSYDGIIPDGFDVILLPPAKYLMFQGEQFQEEDFENAIYALWKAIKNYDPSIIGYKWDEENPRIQLEPIGKRGYIELLAVKQL